jgi:hypothetical protein
VESSNSSLTFSNKYETWSSIATFTFLCAAAFVNHQNVYNTFAVCLSPISFLSLPISPVILIPHIIPLSYRSNTTAERAGSVSCYPAAFADLPADRSIITIVVDACPRYVQMICITSSPRTKPHDICDINFYFHSLCFQSSGALIG